MTTTPINQDTINDAVWAACDTFRGTVDPSIYKDYVLTMLFLKYISDVWQDHYDDYKSKHGGHPELIQELLNHERFVLPRSANFHALHAARHEPGNGERIDKALHAIEENNIHNRLFGQEAIGSTWALAKMNMFLHGEDNHRIEWGDTLRNPKLLESDSLLKHFDVVVANPPFSLEKWGFESAAADKYKRFRRGVPPRTKADYAFILHMIETMKPGTGRMAVVVPHGVLFRGAAEGKIRKQLVDENLLDIVIGLPEKLFYGTGIPAAVLVFRKKKHDDKVLFIDASRDYQDGKNQNVLRARDLEKIVATAAARQSVDKYAYLASPSEIAENDYNLNIPRYVDTFEEEEEIDLMAVRAERMKLKAELEVLEEKMAGYLKELGYE